MMDKNTALGIVRNNLKEHHELGSTFQFFVSMFISTIQEYTELTYDEAHKLAINCVKTLEL